MSNELRHAIGFTVLGIGFALSVWSFFVSRAMRQYAVEHYPEYAKRQVSWWRWKPVFPSDATIKNYTRLKKTIDAVSMVAILGGAALAEFHWFIF
ncbi:MAG: hypothetical protein V1907_05080 [Candidatus Kerfeldbacteria bacterium]